VFLPRPLAHAVDVLGDEPAELLITYLPALSPADTHPAPGGAMTDARPRDAH
jgi:hypothetical protein